MAIRWKKYEMYGPKKPGLLKRLFWYLRDKCMSMRGLYILSVVFLTVLADVFISWMYYDIYTTALYFYFCVGVNVFLWVSLIKRIDRDTTRPFFMNWFKRWNCDVLILFYGVIFLISVFILAAGLGYCIMSYYDWDGNWAGTYFADERFVGLFLPLAAVNVAFLMIIIQHLKMPEMRQSVLLKSYCIRLREWYRKKRLNYQKKYAFEQKVYKEMTVLSGVLVMIALLSMLCVISGGAMRLLIAFFIIAGTVIIFIWLHQHKSFMDDVGILIKEIHEVSDGNTLKESAVPDDSMLYAAGEDLTHVYENLNSSVERQVKSEKMKVDLITNVSHDLKTPLTSIIGYIDLLKKTELSDEARDYVDILSQKSERLKYMIQEVFEISKATSGNMDLHIEMVDICTLLRQTMGDMEERIIASNRVIRKQLSEEPLYVLTDGQKIYRVYQNLIENALKYSLEGSRIFIDAFGDGNNVTTIIKNTSSYEMNFTEETITERFTRGDASRTTEGHGLGLAIVKSFAEACGGTFHIHIDGDMFKAIVVFKRTFPEKNEVALVPEKIYDK